MNNTRILLFSALAACILASCTRPDPQPSDSRQSPVPQTVILTASAETPAGTRSVIQDETRVFWQPGDAIKLFLDGTDSKFTSTATEPEAVSRFSGTLPAVIGFNEGFDAGATLWGLYPWREDAVSDGQSVTTTLPDTQQGCAGSFAPDTYITLGRSTSLSMGFWGVCSGVRFSLTQEGIRQVRLESLGGETLAGRIRIAFADGVPAIQEVSEGKSVITLQAPSSDGFQTGQWYYIVALPGTLEEGFKLVFRQGFREAEAVFERPVTLNRTRFGSLAEVDKGLTFQTPGAGNPDDAISFEDVKIKAHLVAAFDSNQDGELSFREAQQVQSLTDVFKGETGYTSFDEFRFFTGVTEIPSMMCRSWKSLRSICLPESLTSIGMYAFYACESLQEVEIPYNVTLIDRNAFYGCSSLREISLPEGLESIGNWAFYGCALKSLVLPSTLSSIGSSCLSNCTELEDVALPESMTSLNSSLFQGCTALKRITLPAGITRIGASCFKDCGALSEINFPEGVEYIGGSAFAGCRQLHSVTLPGCLTEIGASAFADCVGLPMIVIPAAVSAIRASAFSGCTGLTAVYVKAATPPAGEAGMFDNTGNCPIYVPGATSELYTTAPGWKDYLSRLRSDDGSSIYYTSTDYSRDGEVLQLQKATVGRGVTFILLGDGYVDTDMAPEGKYEQRMRSAMEALFAYEPYRSQRERFNVYTVKVVSANSHYQSSQSNRRLTYDSNGEINFRSEVSLSYAGKVPNPNGQPAKVAVLCNSTTSVGRSYCLRYSLSGVACCIVFDPNPDVLVHELCGHGFGDLWDEYSEKSETFTDHTGLDNDWKTKGWGANADWRNDPATVRWAHFLADSRYAGEGLGIFEGAKTYAKGIYRPSYNSMMRYNNAPFNAPSREQIYKNIMLWSEGGNWQYDYETFVALDEAGRQQAAGRLKAPARNAAPSETTLAAHHAETHIEPLVVDEDVIEVGFPLSGPAIPHLVRK